MSRITERHGTLPSILLENHLKILKKNIHIREFIINKKVITNNKIIADSFNEYFVNVGKSLAKQIVSDVDPMSYIVYSENDIQNVHTTYC